MLKVQIGTEHPPQSSDVYLCFLKKYVEISVFEIDMIEFFFFPHSRYLEEIF
jgi:hypothetical protein